MQACFKRYRVLCLALVLAVFLPLVPVSAAPSGVVALSYIVMDAETGQVLFEKNSDVQYDPASITKIMTVALACEKAQGDWSTELTVSYEDIASIANTGSSHIALQEGEVITLEDALYAVMMASANDAANVLAAYVGGDIAGGVAAMNAQVEELGLENTHFENPHGLNGDTHKVSACDMAEILRWALEQPGFLEIYSNTEMYIMSPTNKQSETRYFSISDSVRIGSSKYYVPEVVGSKTGYTDDSRYTYAALGESDGRSFIVVTLHSEEKTDRYNDAKILFDYAFEHFTAVEIAPSGDSFSVDVYGGDAKLGQASVSGAGTSFYLYDGEGADAITCTYEMDEQYILGRSYTAVATYTLPETANQEGFTVAVPLVVSGVASLFSVNEGISLPASAGLIPQDKLPMVFFALGAIVLVVVLLLLRAIFKRRKPKSRYQRLHKYTR